MIKTLVLLALASFVWGLAAGLIRRYLAEKKSNRA